MEDNTVVVVGADPTAFDELVGRLEERGGSNEARRLPEIGDLFDVLCTDVVHCLVLPESVDGTPAVDVARGVRGLYPDLPDEAVVTMKQSNDESIHQHNAHAERVATVGDLAGEVNGE